MQLSISATQLRESFGELNRRRGVDDFLRDAESAQWGVIEIVAQAIEQLCEPPTRGRLDQVVVLAGALFFVEHFPAAQNAKMVLIKDLVDAMKATGRYQRVRAIPESYAN